MSSSLDALVQLARNWFPGAESDAIGAAIHRALAEADGPLTLPEIDAQLPAAARGKTALRNLVLQGSQQGVLGMWQNRDEPVLGYQLAEREAAEATEVDAAEYYAQQQEQRRRRPARLRSAR